MFTHITEIAAIAVFAALCIFIILQLAFHLLYFIPFIKYKLPKNADNNSEGVSIIISARAEYDNLNILIPALLKQQYPNFEIIIIDDASWDHTKDLIEAFVKSNNNIKGVYLTEDMKKHTLGKKLALTLGIKAASNEILLFTDADCVPASEFWIQKMANIYLKNPNTEIVLGYSPFNRKKTTINLLSRIDNLWTALLYFSFALKKNPYMAVGRNLSYKKSLFMRTKGFANHLHVLSGDDDLFIQDASNNLNTDICLHPNAFVFSESKKYFSDWMVQKTRHHHVGRYYKSNHKRSLGFQYAIHFLFWMSVFANFLFYSNIIWLTIALCLYWTIKTIIIYESFRKFQNSKMAWALPIYDFLYFFYNITFGIISIFHKQKKW